MNYEYEDAVIPWTHSNPHGPAFMPIQDSTGDGMSLEMAKEACWQAERSAILRELSVWFDDGWEPVGQLGPEGVELSVEQSRMPNSLKESFRSLGSILSSTYASPKAYHVLLRRPKGTTAIDEPKQNEQNDYTKWKSKYPSLSKDERGNSLCPECNLPFKSEDETYAHMGRWHSK